jgi:hypothetical protein
MKGKYEQEQGSVLLFVFEFLYKWDVFLNVRFRTEP